MEREFKLIPIDLIDPPKNPRRLNASGAGIEELASSIKQVGLLQPITVFPINGRYETVFGDRRQRACRQADLKEIPCIVVDDPSTLLQVIQLTENIQRMDMTPIEEAASVKDLQDLNNWGYKLLAAHLGKSTQWVRDRLALLEIPPDLQILVHNGQLGQSHALVLGKIEDANTRKNYAEEAMRCGTSVKTLEAWVDMYHHAMNAPDTSMERVEDPANLPQRAPHTIRCQFCEEHYELRFVTSVILCRDCINILREAKLNESRMATSTDPSNPDNDIGMDSEDRTEAVKD